MTIMQVSPQHLAEWFESTGSSTATLLDVREPWELQAASVENSGALPAGMVFKHIALQSLPQRLHELDADSPVAVLCHHGSRSLHAANWLANQGIERLANVQGGIAAWSQSADSQIPTY